MNKEFSEKKKFVAIALKIFLTVELFLQKPCVACILDSTKIFTSMQTE